MCNYGNLVTKICGCFCFYSNANNAHQVAVVEGDLMTSSFADVSELMTSPRDADMLDLSGGSETVAKGTVVRGDSDASQMMMSSLTSSMYGGDLDQLDMQDLMTSSQNADMMTSSTADVGDLMTSSQHADVTNLMTSSQIEDLSVPVLATSAIEQISAGGVEIKMLQPGLLGRDQVIIPIHVLWRKE